MKHYSTFKNQGDHRQEENIISEGLDIQNETSSVTRNRAQPQNLHRFMSNFPSSPLISCSSGIWHTAALPNILY